MQVSKKVLIFDSGVGGLSVYREIHAQLPHYNYVYLFDNQGYPYGELDAAVLIERVSQLVGRMVAEQQIDLVVIACNTASTIVLPRLRQELAIPIVGVVPAIKPAAVLSKQAIGLIATPATVNRPYTYELITTYAAQHPVKLLGSTRLVTMAEQKLRGQVVDLVELKQILRPLYQQIDVAVLGCTHFPLLADEIQQVLGESVRLIDSGKAIATRVQSLLASRDRTFAEKEIGQSLYPYPIFSSAEPWQVTALNLGLQQFGFSPVHSFPLLDA